LVTTVCVPVDELEEVLVDELLDVLELVVDDDVTDVNWLFREAIA